MKIIILILMFFKLTFFQNLESGEIRIKVSNLDEQRGTIHYGLYDNAEFFLNEEGKVLGGYENVSKVLNEGLTIKNLDESIYAIAIYHDRNSNNKFDKIFSIPVEKFGFSKNAKIFLGPPKFDDASFFLGENDQIEMMIELK